MITRFRLEAENVSKDAAMLDLSGASDEIFALEGTSAEHWECTQDVSQRLQNGAYKTRVVWKRRLVEIMEARDE
jgi:hypothetical protein